MEGWNTNKSINQLVGEITSLSILISNNTKATVFTEYMGHVHGFTIRFYSNGWRDNLDPDIQQEVSLNPELTTEKEAIKKLRQIKKVLIQFGIKGKLDFSKLPYEIEVIEKKQYYFCK